MYDIRNITINIESHAGGKLSVESLLHILMIFCLEGYPRNFYASRHIF